MHLHLNCWPAGLSSTFHSSSVSSPATGNVKNLKCVNCSFNRRLVHFFFFSPPPVFLLRAALMFWTEYNQFVSGNQRLCLYWNNLHINLMRWTWMLESLNKWVTDHVFAGDCVTSFHLVFAKTSSSLWSLLRCVYTALIIYHLLQT